MALPIIDVPNNAPAKAYDESTGTFEWVDPKAVAPRRGGEPHREALRDAADAGGAWKDLPETDWNDWRWQQRNRITRMEQLEKVITRHRRRAARPSTNRTPCSTWASRPTTPSLMDPEDPELPHPPAVASPRWASSPSPPPTSRTRSPKSETCRCRASPIAIRTACSSTRRTTARCTAATAPASARSPIPPAPPPSSRSRTASSTSRSTRRSATSSSAAAIPCPSRTIGSTTCSAGCAPFRTSRSSGSARATWSPFPSASPTTS